MAVSLETPDGSYCRIPSKFFDCGGMLAVSKHQVPIRMETLTKSFSTSLPEEGNDQKIFVCIKTVSTTTSVLCLDTRSFHSGDRCATADLGQSFPLCIFADLPYSTSLAKSQLRPNRKNVACHTNLAVSNLVPLLREMSIVCPLLLPRNTSLIKPQGDVHPLITNRILRLAVQII